ncbi:hypothetical protein Gotur_020223 [Gossypium turneri]
MDVPKSKKYKRTRSTRDMDNFLWGMELYFRAIDIEDKVAKGTVRKHVKDFSEFMFQIYDLSEKETFNWFRDKWKLWAKQELHQQGITELTVAMFKTWNDERDRGENGQVKNGNGGNVKYYPKKFALSAIEGDDELEKASMKLGSILSSVEAKRARENENKPMKCFLCCGLHWIRDYRDEALKLGSMIINFAKAKRDHKQKGLVYVDINIITQRKSDLINTRTFDLFILKKVIVSRDMRGGTKVLSAIQLAENVPYGKNIDLVDQSATKTSLEMLEVQKINMNPVELSIM